ncbi:O-succinylbenzoic acid--CoA ligase [Antricoccus suffuscus]|uniref:O-succinylbenzoic acid--CoA ligase n=1 Tax=Antricoccus suffuscus TaxID=1629062 RepID=A0A2T0ZS01_9ACTN|nr:AMP-binding protein [Antricoccus suffuscus]PRZ39093.1 O-succinylbenzoic acid--CoA ligase [Antricoccus suffuscus]
MPRFLEPLWFGGTPTAADVARVAGVLDDPAGALLPLSADDRGHGDRVLQAAQVESALETGEDDPRDPTVLGIATSGSTGVPKIVLLSRSALVASGEATAARVGGHGQWNLCLGLTHIAGVQVVLRSALAGTAPVRCPAGGPDFPAAFARTTNEMTGGRRYVSMVPTQLRRLLDDPDSRIALTSYDAILLGGAAADPALLAQARALDIRIVTTYGMSETSGGCVYDGVPLDGVRTLLGEAGQITLAGPVVARGYRHGARLADNPFIAGKFRTSDVGAMAGNELQVLGRSDHLINTGGEKVAPAVVEAAMRELPGITDVAVVGVPDVEWGEVVAALVVAPGDVDLDAVRRELTGRVPTAALPKKLVTVAAIPRMGIGKLDHKAAVTLAIAKRD